MPTGNASEYASIMSRMQQNSGFAGRDFSRFKGIAPTAHGAKMVLPSRDGLAIWENCYIVACQYVGYKEREMLYRVQAISKRADYISKTFLQMLFLKFYQDGDHELMLRVASNMITAFQVLRNSRGNFKPADIINTAHGITIGDTDVTSQSETFA